MSAYIASLAGVVAEHHEELLSDLESLRAQRENLDAEVTSVERQLGMLEGLLDLRTTTAGSELRFTMTEIPLTLHGAMAEVLKTAPQRMMRAGDLAAAIDRRGLYRMRDGRPVEAQQIHARVGHYSSLFTKEGTFIKLK